MKKLLLASLIPLCLWSCKTEGYRIEGNIPGAPEGLTAWLVKTDVYPNMVLDSAAVTDGRFDIRHETSLEYPHQASIIIGKGPYSDRPDTDTKAYRFFLDNGDITFDCMFDSLPSFYWEPRSKEHNVTLKGSPTQDIQNLYNERVRPLTTERAELRNKYLEVYHVPALDGVFNTAEGMDIVRRQNAASAKINQIAMDFIREHNTSVASVDIADRMLMQPTAARFTVEQIDAIVEMFDPSVRKSPAYASLKQNAAAARDLAYGEKYKDIELVDREGKKVMLSDYVKPGQYNMLEFWASWCGPCRGEIPHLRHLYEQADPDVFNMISISIDENNADWQKAMTEEKMVWTQLNDPKGHHGPVSSVYHINGIPDCLILDPEGRIVGGKVRGAELDLLLTELLGDKIHIE